jgi:hypothetical protein
MPLLTESGTYGPTAEFRSTADHDSHGVLTFRWNRADEFSCASPRFRKVQVLPLKSSREQKGEEGIVPKVGFDLGPISHLQH